VRCCLLGVEGQRGDGGKRGLVHELPLLMV
jgi:hypothetical protein